MNCKKGDLAIAVSPQVSANLGVIVECLELILDHWCGEPVWWCRSLCGPRMSTTGCVAMEGYCRDAALRPLRPEEMPEAVERKTALTA